MRFANICFDYAPDMLCLRTCACSAKVAKFWDTPPAIKYSPWFVNCKRRRLIITLYMGNPWAGSKVAVIWIKKISSHLFCAPRFLISFCGSPVTDNGSLHSFSASETRACGSEVMPYTAPPAALIVSATPFCRSFATRSDMAVTKVHDRKPAAWTRGSIIHC